MLRYGESGGDVFQFDVCDSGNTCCASLSQPVYGVYTRSLSLSLSSFKSGQLCEWTESNSSVNLTSVNANVQNYGLYLCMPELSLCIPFVRIFLKHFSPLHNHDWFFCSILQLGWTADCNFTKCCLVNTVVNCVQLMCSIILHERYTFSSIQINPSDQYNNNSHWRLHVSYWLHTPC